MNKTTPLLVAGALALLALAPGAQAIHAGPVSVEVNVNGLPGEVPDGIVPGDVVNFVLAFDPACGSIDDGVETIARQCTEYVTGLIGPAQDWANDTRDWALEWAGRASSTGQYFDYAEALSTYGRAEAGYAQDYANQYAIDPAFGFAGATLTDATDYASAESAALNAWREMAVHRANDEAGQDVTWAFCRVSGSNCGLPPVPTLPIDAPIPGPVPGLEPLPGQPPQPDVEQPPVFQPQLPGPVPPPPH